MSITHEYRKHMYLKLTSITEINFNSVNFVIYMKSYKFHEKFIFSWDNSDNRKT